MTKDLFVRQNLGNLNKVLSGEPGNLQSEVGFDLPSPSGRRAGEEGIAGWLS